MKAFKYVVLCLLSIGALSLVPFSVHAQPDAESGASTACGSSTFLLFPAWYNGLTEAVGNDCNIMSPEKAGGLDVFIWKIVLNVVEMLLIAAGYLAVGFIIYGGYKYMISAGSPDGMVAARKTIMNACIGLVLSLAAVGIVNTVSNGLGIGG